MPVPRSLDELSKVFKAIVDFAHAVTCRLIGTV